MKSFLLPGIIAVLLVFGSCNRGRDGSEKKNNENRSAKNISSRNYFINANNAVNDFFFDSSTLLKYINKRQLPDSISRRMISFYNSRNYQFAWFSSMGVSEQARGFWNMYNYYSVYEPGKVTKEPVFFKSTDSIMTSTDSVWNEKQLKLTTAELQLTEHFIRFFLSNTDKGYLKRKEMEKFIPSLKADPITIADSLVNKKHKDERYYKDINKTYGALLEYLSKYLVIYKRGGWPQIHVKASSLKPGVSGPAVLILKKRLYLSGDTYIADSTVTWTTELTDAIKKFQHRHGYRSTGLLTDIQLADMNIPVKERIEQLLINLSRTLWVIDQPQDKFILVNIPEFLLHATDNGKKVFDMPVVVGIEGHNTMIFTGRLNQVVFAPYWNVPENIVEKEILPGIEKDPNYLSKNQMEVIGRSGKGFPMIRQLPGPKNSLGLVKFLFPNSYDIYFHDTPAKSLFAKENRAFSHGCIRLSQPMTMAKWLLENDHAWNNATINKAMHETEEKKVNIKKPVPVLITYYTAWVDEEGSLRFANDIYGHDKIQIQKMFNSF